MGREIRRVPPNWEHPTYERQGEYGWMFPGAFRPMHDQTFDDALDKWLEGRAKWRAGTHEDQLNPNYSTDGNSYVEWCGGPPDPELHRPEFTEEPTWYQVYQTVSEGTPVTPPFATKEEIVEYLTTHGEMRDGEPNQAPISREAAEQFVKEEFAISMALTREVDQGSHASI